MHFKAFLDCNIAPITASKIGIFDTAGNKVGTIPLFNFKKRQSPKLYSFGLISDIHIQVEDTYDSGNDLIRAFNYFTEQGIDMTCCCGDVVDTNVLQEYENFKTIKDQYPNISFYSCTGNHDCSGASGYNAAYWNTYMGTDKTFEMTHNGDHFLFLGMNAWNFQSGYTDQDLNWLEAKLNEYRNERSFVFMHCPIPQYVGNYKEMYTSHNWLTGGNLYRITEMVNYYKNSVWFSGHSHWKWHLQKWEENANIYRNNSAWNVHIPSCAIPGDAIDDVQIGRVVEGNEGAVVDVYEDYIEIKGIDLKTGKYIPVGQYRLDTIIENIIDKDNSATIKLTYDHLEVSNKIGIIEKGQSYINTFTLEDGYTIESIVVKMDGVDITDSALSDNEIYIQNVTGDIEITIRVTELEYLIEGQLKASDFALLSTDYGQTVTQDGNDIVFNFPTLSSAKFSWVAGNAVGSSYSPSTHIAVLEHDGVEYSQELSDLAKCYVGFIDLSNNYYTLNENAPISWSNGTDPIRNGVQFNMSSRFGANGGAAPLTIRLINPRVRIRIPKKHSVSQTLTHCASSYVSTTISEMITRQKITFTPSQGYVMDEINITMNGKPIPYAYINGNSILIETITGDIDIVATAKEAVEFDGINQIPISVDLDGSVFNGVGYQTNKRIDYASGDVVDATTNAPNASVTGFIPFAPGDILYFYRVPWNIATDLGEINIILYEEDKVTKVNNVNPSDFVSRLGGTCPGIASDPKSCFIYFANEESNMFAIAFNPNSTSSMVAKTKWIRITTTELLDEYSIISKNQPITDGYSFKVETIGTAGVIFSTTTSNVSQFTSFETEVTAQPDSILDYIKVTMNGQDVSGWYLKDNIVSIPYVYGDTRISAAAHKIPKSYVDVPITYSTDTRLSQSGGHQTPCEGAVATSRIDLTNVPKPCYFDMTGVAWAANSTATHPRIVYSIDLMNGMRSNGYTGTNGSTNPDYNDGINNANIERRNELNNDITIKITDPGISTIAFSGYTGTEAAGDGFTGNGNMADADIKVWYDPEEAITYDFTGNLLEKLDVRLNQRWSASAKNYTTENGMAAIQIPMSVVLGKQIKITGFSVTKGAGGGARGSIANIVLSDGTAASKVDPLNTICTNNGDGSYTFTVPNGEVETAHQIIVLSLVGNTTGAMSEEELANCKVEIL